MIKPTLKKLAAQKNLSIEEARDTMMAIMSGSLDPVQTSAFLMGLRTKKETVDELYGCAQAMIQKKVQVTPKKQPLLDTCGTGGDGQHTINISTISALMIAAYGIPIAKHGNRSVSSQCGSADVLEELGFPLLKDPALVAEAIDKYNFGFLFAPHFHPAMKYVGAIRKSLGLRTVFNLLGPLANPAQAEYQVIGVFAPEWVEPVAQLAQKLGNKRTLVVHSSEGLDELSLGGVNHLAIATPDNLTLETWHPEASHLPRVPLSDLSGGDATHNAAAARAILAGEDSGRAQTCWLNAGAGLFAYGAVNSLEEGYHQIRELCLTHKAHSHFQTLTQES